MARGIGLYSGVWLSTVLNLDQKSGCASCEPDSGCRMTRWSTYEELPALGLCLRVFAEAHFHCLDVGLSR